MKMVRGLKWRRSCQRLIAAGPNRACGRMPRTLMPATVDSLNLEPLNLSSHATELRELIWDISAANPRWGSPRILGELRKLGIPVAKSTVEKYRVHPRRPASPSWRAFLKNHLTDIVALDFFTVPTVNFKVLLVLAEIAPGIDPAKDILSQMEFSIAIPPGVATMDPAIFRED